MSTQLQLRRGTNAQVVAGTPASGEPWFNTTTDRLSLGNGAQAGGFPHALVSDVQNQATTFAISTGTTNAQAITLAPAIVAYVTGAIFWFQANATNTSQTPTLSVNGLTGKTIQKGGGALQPSDITSGKIYGVQYDGTNFQLIGNVVLNEPTVYSATGGNILVPFATYEKDTTAGALVDSLPASASLGDVFVVRDPAGTWQTNTYTVNANGHSIAGSVQNVAGDINRLTMSFTCTIAGSPGGFAVN